jgi:hypothetical protein
MLTPVACFSCNTCLVNREAKLDVAVALQALEHTIESSPTNGVMGQQPPLPIEPRSSQVALDLPESVRATAATPTPSAELLALQQQKMSLNESLGKQSQILQVCTCVCVWLLYGVCACAVHPRLGGYFLMK